MRRWTVNADGASRGFDPRHSGQDTLLVVRQGRRLFAYADACPHHGTQSPPVCAAIRPAASCTWSWRVARPSSDPVSASTTPCAGTRSRSRRKPLGP